MAINPDWATASYAIARHQQRYFDEIRAAAESLTFSWVNDALASSMMIGQFVDTFESVAFASFDIGGPTSRLALALKSAGHGADGLADSYFSRLLSSAAMRAQLPRLAMNGIIDSVPERSNFAIEDALPTLGDSAPTSYARAATTELALYGLRARTRVVQLNQRLVTRRRFSSLTFVVGPKIEAEWRLPFADSRMPNVVRTVHHRDHTAPSNIRSLCAGSCSTDSM